MSKHTSRPWINTLPQIPKNLLLVGGLAGSIGTLIATTNIRLISSAGLITLLINTLRIMFIVYLLFSIGQILKSANRGKDHNT